MASPLSQTGQDIATAVLLRLGELGHALSPSHQAAVVGDIMAAINAAAVNVVAHAALDVVNYKPPPHNIKF